MGQSAPTCPSQPPPPPQISTKYSTQVNTGARFHLLSTAHTCPPERLNALSVKMVSCIRFRSTVHILTFPLVWSHSLQVQRSYGYTHTYTHELKETGSWGLGVGEGILTITVQAKTGKGEAGSVFVCQQQIHQLEGYVTSAMFLFRDQ